MRLLAYTRLLFTALVVMSTSGMGAFAQPAGENPIKTTLCELETAPEKFNGKFVKVTAKVLTGFEASLLTDSEGCRIWLTWPHGTYLAIGGDAGSEYALMDGLADVKRLDQLDWIPIIQAPAVKLIEDRNYQVLAECLNREYKSNRRYLCIDCPLCEATTTVIGRFDVADRRLKAIRKANGEVSFGGGGFGHLGAWDSQLVAQSFSDVVTQPIDKSVYERVRIAGTITNQFKSGIANAGVSVRDHQSGAVVVEARTNAEGIFALQGLRSGKYELTCVAEGFRPKRIRINPEPSAAIILKPIRLRSQ